MIKDFFTTLMIIALSLFIIAAVPNDSDAAIYEDTLRLHILANSVYHLSFALISEQNA